MLAPPRSILASMCSLPPLVRRLPALLGNAHGADAQVDWRRSINFHGGAAHRSAILYLRSKWARTHALVPNLPRLGLPDARPPRIASVPDCSAGAFFRFLRGAMAPAPSCSVSWVVSATCS